MTPPELPYVDPEREREYKRQWAAANREKQRGYERAWREREMAKPAEERWQAQKAWKKRNPEQQRRAELAWRKRRLQDPAYRQALREDRRIDYRLRKEREGEGLTVAREFRDANGAYRPLTDVHASMRAERLDAAPFFAWLDVWQEERKAARMNQSGRTAEAAAVTLQDLCKLAGFDVKRLSESRTKGTIRLDLAEAFLDIADGPQVWELYS